MFCFFSFFFLSFLFFLFFVFVFVFFKARLRTVGLLLHQSFEDSLLLLLLLLHSWTTRLGQGAGDDNEFALRPDGGVMG